MIASPNNPKTKKKTTRRRYGKRIKNKNVDIYNSNNNKKVDFIVVGANASGINTKKESLLSLINMLSPSVLMIQEKKMQTYWIPKVERLSIF